MREQVGHYRLMKPLGEGGMGIVYEARDERLDRAVALKMIKDDALDARARERFAREARLAARLTHPNICQLFDFGEEDGALFFVMELLEGEPLDARLARGPLAPRDAAEVILSILAALAALHRQGLVHRDLKPSNVFLTPTGVKLLDFGLARPVDTSTLDTYSGLTVAGMVVGTPQYLAPEQALGQALDARADLFAAGAMLHEMLTGRPLFAGNSAIDVLHAVLHQRPPALAGSPLVVALDRVIHRAVAKTPDERFPSADDMADAVRGVLVHSDSGEVLSARPITRLIVLPLRILRPDAETDFLAFGLADAVTHSLSGLESIVVRSSETAAKLAAATTSPEEVAAKSEVDLVLTGTLLRAGDTLRMTTQLVDAHGTVRWSHVAQVALGDVFQLQDELTQRIVSSMSLPLSPADQRRLRPDVPRTPRAYEAYLRANQIAYQSDQWLTARELYMRCLEEDAAFAPAWAQLGRIHRVIALYRLDDTEAAYEQAQQAFRRALELNPDLGLAHNLYTHLEVELGQAEHAMLRLLDRARDRGADPALFAGLVQACRYCGLEDAAVAAYEEARRLDPTVRTSVHHAYLTRGEYARALQTNIEDPPVLNIALLELLGDTARALELARALERRPLPRVYHLFAAIPRAWLEGRRDECLALAEELLTTWNPRDPCGRYYLARMLAQIKHPQALPALRGSIEGGFVPYGFLLRDPALDPVRAASEFRALLDVARARFEQAAASFHAAGGPRLLGMADVARP